uniref:Succinate dehydrogenase assembly factor 2, mitochondrial n=1 Tax=Meloidogyne floridensis TaxID=298350 RepID=A0A915NJ06_9BILA
MSLLNRFPSLTLIFSRNFVTKNSIECLRSRKFAEENLPKMNKNDLVNYDAIINGNYMEWDLYYYLTGRKEAPNELISNPLFKNMKEYILLNNQKNVKNNF